MNANLRLQLKPRLSSWPGLPCDTLYSGQLGYQRRVHPGTGRRVGGPLEVILAPAPVPLPLQPGERVVAAAAGRAHSLLVTSNGRALSLGSNSYGQCGRPVVEGEDYTAERQAWEVELEPGAGRVVGVECGQDHTLLLTDRGQVWACGWGADGQVQSPSGLAVVGINMVLEMS